MDQHEIVIGEETVVYLDRDREEFREDLNNIIVQISKSRIFSESAEKCKNTTVKITTKEGSEREGCISKPAGNGLLALHTKNNSEEGVYKILVNTIRVIEFVI